MAPERVRLAMRLILYAVALFGAYAMLQRDHLYLPDTLSLPEAIDAARSDGLHPWPGSEDYRGLRRDPEGPARATLVLFHGNAGHAGHRAWYADQLGRLGLRVILAEYPGYGPRPGTPSEALLTADAAETVLRVRRDFPGPILLAGESLGAAVAAAVAGNSHGIAALLLFTPWDKLENVARHHYPWMPISLLLRDRYDTATSLAAFRGRVAVIVAANDSIVPATFGRALFDALAEPKRLWSIPGADHNDWLGHVDAAWWRQVIDFALANGPHEAGADS